MKYNKIILAVVLLTVIVGCSNDTKEKPQNEAIPEKKVLEKADSVKNLAEEVKQETLKNSNILKKVEEPKGIKVKSISDLWKIYKSEKIVGQELLNKNDLEKGISHLDRAGKAAIELGRYDIAAWQYNNIGHYSIQEFQRVTEYDKRMRTLATISSQEEKKKYSWETKLKFEENILILETAEKYLQEALLLDDELEESERTEAIKRNLDFVNWIKAYVK